MRFFTEHFFSEDQKRALLGGRYEQAGAGPDQAGPEVRGIDFDMAKARERLLRDQEEFERGERFVDRALLPFILAITLGLGFVSSLWMDGPI